MRQFKLINGNGDEWDLTSPTCFLHDVNSLGLARNVTYSQAGSYFIVSSNRIQQVNPSGTIAFLGDSPYELYNDFVDFTMIEPLTLVYSPNIGEYRKDVIMQTLDKTEINKDGYLDCPVVFAQKTPWYKKVSVVTEPIVGTVNQNEWPFMFPITFSKGEDMSVNINSDSRMTDSPCKLTIYGPLQNPSWKVYTNGKEVSTGKINTTVPAGCYLEIDNTGEVYTIQIFYSHDGTFYSDVYQASDFSTKRWVNLGHGSNHIVVASELPNKVTIKAEGRLYYETV